MMKSNIPARQKWVISMALMLLFYSIIFYVNLRERTWSGFLFRAVKIILPELLIGIGITYLFLMWAERIIAFFERHCNGKLKYWSGLFSLLSLLSSGVVVTWLSFIFVDYFLTNITGTPDKTLHQADEYTRMSMRVSYGLLFIMVIFIYFVLMNRQIMWRSQEIRVAFEKLEKEKARQSYITLQNQVNPHFLFNNLSTLSSLVKKDADLSEMFIDRLSKAYRYIFDQRDHQLVTLQKEVEYIKSYVFLLQARFENKMEVHISVHPEKAERTLVAPFTLQHLVETALKNNRMSAREPLRMAIKTGNEDYLLVSNNIQLRGGDMVASDGDYQRLADHYQLLTAQPVVMEVVDDTCCVKIPLVAAK